MDEYESLSHSKWECKYHVVFIPKCRRKTLYGELRRHLGEVFRRLAEQKESRVEGRASDARSRAYDDFDPAEVCGVAGDRVHQRKECDSSRARIRRAETQFRRAALLGQRVFRLDSRARRSGDSRIHSATRGRRQALGSDESVALRSHLQVAPFRRRRVSDPGKAALSGSQSKAPGFAGG